METPKFVGALFATSEATNLSAEKPFIASGGVPRQQPLLPMEHRWGKQE